MYEVNPETCTITESPEGRLTLKSAALQAYHLAGEKLNRWSEVKNAAWGVYAEEAAKAQESAGTL